MPTEVASRTPADLPRTSPTPVRRWLVLSVLCVSLLIVSLDNTILNVALPTLVRDLHASSSELQWIVDAYAVVFAGLLLVLGSLGDRLGRKGVYVTGLAIFAAGSAASAFSGSASVLVATRAVMGVGAAAIMPSTLSILTNVFTDATSRARAIGIWSGTSGLGIALGPIAGGWLLAHYWWGSVFLVNVPIALAGLVATMFLVPTSKDPASRKPDPFGAVLSIVGMGLLLWAIIEAPGRSWTSPAVVGSGVGAVVLLAGFVHWERRSASPMLELSLFRSRRFSVAMGAMMLAIFSLMGTLFLLTQYLQFSLGYTPLETGIRVAPVAATLLVISPLSSLLSERIGTKPVVTAGLVLIAIGLFYLSRTSVAGTYASDLPGLLLLGVGTGLAFAPATESVMGSLPPARAGIGSAMNSAALQTGGALGVGILGSLLNSRYQDRLGAALAHVTIPHAVRDLITASLGGALEVAAHLNKVLGRELSSVARSAFVDGMDIALLVGAIIVAVAALVVLALLPNRAPGSTRGRSRPAQARPAPSRPGQSGASDL